MQMDLSIKYCGLELAHPLMPGASPMVDDMDTVRHLEDAGASAIVMHSLFEEQIVAEQFAALRTSEFDHSYAEATSYFPDPEGFILGPAEYLEQIVRIREAVDVPVIASLNGTAAGRWLEHATLMEQAGADALELNVYSVVTDADDVPDLIEDETVAMLTALKKAITIPVAVKLSPFYTALPNFARRLEAAGVDGLVLFNRFYQPDIDIENLEVVHSLKLSDSSELLLRLRWLAVVSAGFNKSLAVTGGVHTAVDAVKAVMCGAHAVQMVSALLQHGPGHIGKVKTELEAWLEENEYDSLAQMHGNMNLAHCPNPRAYERGNYMHVIQSWWGE
jgi:dihydroorotate dehydrogenase (fumarate)